jgi:hypothetical protein
VKSTGSCASWRTLTNHRNPVKTMIGPTLFSGRARHDNSPLPMNDHPTRSASGTLGICGRSEPASLATQAAPAPASSPARASRISFAFISRCIVTHARSNLNEHRPAP